MFDFAASERAEYERRDQFAASIVEAIAALPVKNAETMAKAAYEKCREACAAEGMDPDIECMIKDPSESGNYMGGTPGIWIVGWESGPYQWAVGCGMGIVMATGKLAETYYGFDLQFYPGEDA